MLKETPQSLRQYFGLVAIITLVFGIASLVQSGGAPVAILLSLVAIVFGVWYLYITVRFPQLLYGNPKLIRGVLLANLVYSFISFALSLTGGLQVGGLVRLGLTIAIFLYLTKSVDRLSAQGKIAGDA